MSKKASNFQKKVMSIGYRGKVNGEVKNQDYYNKAQKAVQGSAQYASLFLESGSLNPTDVDAITGATYSYDQFTDAVFDALQQAEE